MRGSQVAPGVENYRDFQRNNSLGGQPNSNRKFLWCLLLRFGNAGGPEFDYPLPHLGSLRPVRTRLAPSEKLPRWNGPRWSRRRTWKHEHSEIGAVSPGRRWSCVRRTRGALLGSI